MAVNMSGDLPYNFDKGNKAQYVHWLKTTTRKQDANRDVFRLTAAMIGLSLKMPPHQVTALLDTYATLGDGTMTSSAIVNYAIETLQKVNKRHTFTTLNDLYDKIEQDAVNKIKGTEGGGTVEQPRLTVKDTNPKDAVGVKKGRSFSSMSWHVNRLVGLGMLEGARKYGRHNYRIAGVRSSVYFDATLEHLTSWWEGEDIDKDSGLSHIIKAICSLYVLADAEISGMLNDDRPPRRKDITEFKAMAQKLVDEIFERTPNAVAAYTKND